MLEEGRGSFHKGTQISNHQSDTFSNSDLYMMTGYVGVK